ncbi:MAG: beta-galactosidase, partial [Xanthomonadales bacterium]
MDPHRQRSPFRFAEATPRLGERVYIDPRAHVSGAVELGDDASVWPMAVLRGDVNRITIGARSNVQDNSVLHVTHESAWQPAGLPLIIGADVTIGHAAILHACTVGDRCLVGMGAIVMDGAVLEPESMVAAGALVLWLDLAGTRDQEPMSFVPLAVDKTLGVAADLSGLDAASLDESLAAMKSAGFRWLRQRFPWNAIEQSAGKYEWSAWDRVVEAAVDHELELIAVLDGSPDWARAAVDGENPLAPPTETRDFGEFAAAFAERYGDRIDYYQ